MISRLVQYAIVIASKVSTYVTGGVLLAVFFFWDSFLGPVPLWYKVFIAMAATVVAGYFVWDEQRREAQRLRDRLAPRLEIDAVPIHDGHRYRIRVQNTSATTVRFSARLEATRPAIDYGLPVRLQITHHATPEANIPAGQSALVDVFIDAAFIVHDEDGSFLAESIGFLVFGEPPGVTHVDRIRYEILVSAFPVDVEGGEAVFRRFHIIPQFQQPCIFGDAGTPYREPIR